MHSARLDSSERLRRAHAYLSDGGWHTTRDILFSAHVCAVNSVVAELRDNGCDIACVQRGRVFWYRMARDGVGRPTPVPAGEQA